MSNTLFICTMVLAIILNVLGIYRITYSTAKIKERLTNLEIVVSVREKFINFELNK